MRARAKSCKNGSRSFGGGIVLWIGCHGLIEADRWSQVLRVYGNDPTDTLRSFLVRDLYDFFYWLLGERRGRIKKARTV